MAGRNRTSVQVSFFLPKTLYIGNRMFNLTYNMEYSMDQDLIIDLKFL